VHIAIVTRDRIVAGLQDVFASLAAGKHAGMNSAITFITGPSRTADIELTLVVGVHGPQVLNVVILEQQ
jgi:L-lactate dehydrogenase complex protein LldG